MSKNLASFEYLDKSLIVLSVANCSISTALVATAIEAPVGIMNVSCSLTFFITTGFVKKFLKMVRNKKKKHNKSDMLARIKLNSIKGKISEALINNEISHKDFMTILSEEKKYRELKENIRMMNSYRIDAKKLA